jgi:hypothetical protein
MFQDALTATISSTLERTHRIPPRHIGYAPYIWKTRSRKESGQYAQTEEVVLERNSSLRPARSASGWIAVDDAAAVGPDIDSSIKTRIASDLQDKTPLMLIVVDSRPRARLIDGAKDTRLAVHGSGKVEGRIHVVRSGFAKAEGMDLVDARETNEGDIARGPRRSRVIKTVEGSQPKIAGAARRCIDLVLASAIVAA